MSDVYMREAAPIRAEVWAKIDDMVVQVVKKNLVGRRFVDLVGPLGWGVEMAPVSGFGKQGGAAVIAEKATYKPLVELGAEFMLRAKQMAQAANTPFGLDLGAVAWAAADLAKAEDELILSGLMAKAASAPLGNWDEEGGAFKAIAAATAQLRSSGYDGPYVAVLSPGMYARLAAQVRQGRREIEMVEKVLRGELYQSPVMPEDQVLVASPHAWNFDLVVGQDVITAYLGNEGLDQRFRIFETLVLRIKLPGSVCVLK
ncbi:MAG: family 1 encapsulin nanocompartment shell protein [Chloroflexota bacterium]